MRRRTDTSPRVLMFTAALGYGGAESPLLRLTQFLARHIDLSLFIFDCRADPRAMAQSSGFPSYIWSPMHWSHPEYCRCLAEQDLIAPSRAHGAICAAVLGIPSLIFELEPKLRTIHGLLPAITRIVGLDASVMTPWLPAIEELLAVDRTAIATDLARNRAMIQKAVSESWN